MKVTSIEVIDSENDSTEVIGNESDSTKMIVKASARREWAKRKLTSVETSLEESDCR